MTTLPLPAPAARLPDYTPQTTHRPPMPTSHKWWLAAAVAAAVIILGLAGARGATHGTSSDLQRANPAATVPHQTRIEQAVETYWATLNERSRIIAAEEVIYYPPEAEVGFINGYTGSGGNYADALTAWHYLTTVVMPRDLPAMFTN